MLIGNYNYFYLYNRVLIKEIEIYAYRLLEQNFSRYTILLIIIKFDFYLNLFLAFKLKSKLLYYHITNCSNLNMIH